MRAGRGWGCAIKRILYWRLPERLAGRFPALPVEVAIGTLSAVTMVGARMSITTVETTAFALNFAAVVIATVLAGWRSGLVALVVGQLLAWFVLIEPRWSFGIANNGLLVGLLLSTFSQLLILTILSLYQREIARGLSDREARVDLLSRALEEMDHRTRNNYQTVLALVQLQGQRSKHAEVREALSQVADRIQALTRATERLGHRSEDLGVVRLRDHLCELCDQVERGLSRDGVKVECDVEDLVASTEKAAYLSIIVNELVTNALKHAFRDNQEGLIRVWSQVVDPGVTIIVEDNGAGLSARPANGRSGLGTRLIERFARELGCKHEVQSSHQGTTHRLLIPNLS